MKKGGVCFLLFGPGGGVGVMMFFLGGNQRHGRHL